MNNHLHDFHSRDALHQALSYKIALILKEAIEQEGMALMAVSGGSTPKPFFEMLSRIPLNWERVTVTLVDERWVDEDHPDSNAKLVQEYLLKNHAKAATFIPLKNEVSTPFEGLERCNELSRKLHTPFDVIVLGMGTDGHTASFFPHDANLDHALTTHDFCAATIPIDAPHQRMTLSLHTILKAKRLFLHIEGQNKKTVYNAALEAGMVETMPIRAVLNNSKILEVYYAD